MLRGALSGLGWLGVSEIAVFHGETDSESLTFLLSNFTGVPLQAALMMTKIFVRIIKSHRPHS